MVQYIFNKDVIFNEAADTIFYTKNGGKTISFDDYAKWLGDYTYGIDSIMAQHSM